MTREFTNGRPLRLPAFNFLSQYYFYYISLQKYCRFSLQTLAKFEAAKIGSAVGFLRLTALCLYVARELRGGESTGAPFKNREIRSSKPKWFSFTWNTFLASQRKVKFAVWCDRLISLVLVFCRQQGKTRRRSRKKANWRAKFSFCISYRKIVVR